MWAFTGVVDYLDFPPRHPQERLKTRRSSELTELERRKRLREQRENMDAVERLTYDEGIDDVEPKQ